MTKFATTKEWEDEVLRQGTKYVLDNLIDSDLDCSHIRWD